MSINVMFARSTHYKPVKLAQGDDPHEAWGLLREASASSELRRLHGRSASVLDGIPIAIKANFGSRDLPLNTHRTQLIARKYRCPYDATLVGPLTPVLTALQYCFRNPAAV